jgi:predicted phosphodiesterase
MRNVHTIDTLLTYELGMIPEARIIPIGDVHLGAPDCDFEAFKAEVDRIARTPRTYAILMGDLLNTDLIGSKGDPYYATIPPGVQKREMVNALEPIRDKVLGIVSGNHERRMLRAVGSCPTYDIAAKLDIEDRYRETMAFLRIGLGKNAHGKEYTYRLMMIHGSGGGGKRGAMVSRMDDFFQSFDGVDIFVYGHSHKPGNTPDSKVMIDSQNRQILQRPVLTVCAGSWCAYGGYAPQNAMRPVALPGTGEIWMSGTSWAFNAMAWAGDL